MPEVDTLTPARSRPPGDPVGQAQATFRVALDALAHPGRCYRLPAGAVDAPGNPWAAALLLALLDHETPLWVAPVPAGAPATTGSAGTPDMATYLRQRTGARLVPLHEAGFVLADAGSLDEGALEALPGRLRRGTLAYPDEGATLVLSVPRLEAPGADGADGADEADEAATAGADPGAPEDDRPTGAQKRPRETNGLTLACSGPGVPAGERRVLRVAGAGAGLVAARDAAVSDYPAGIDLFLVDGAGRLAGLPRSTRLERIEGMDGVEAHRDGL